MAGWGAPEKRLRVRITRSASYAEICETTPTVLLDYDLTAEGALLVLRVGVLGGRLSGRDQQPGKLDLWLFRLSFDELDQK
jgi:hypothetical protein